MKKSYIFLIIIPILLVAAFLFLYFKYNNSYSINKEDDILDVLKEIDIVPYNKQDIYKVSFIEDKVFVLYRNKRYEQNYIFRVFQKGNIFSDRYRVLYVKENNFLDSKLVVDTFKDKDYALGFTYGVDLDGTSYNIVIETNRDGGYKIHEFNNPSGDFIQVIKLDGKNSNFIPYTFSSLDKKNEFIEGLENPNLH